MAQLIQFSAVLGSFYLGLAVFAGLAGPSAGLNGTELSESVETEAATESDEVPYTEDFATTRGHSFFG